MSRKLLLNPSLGLQALSPRRQHSTLFLQTTALPTLHIPSLHTLPQPTRRMARRSPTADHRRLFPIRAIESSTTKEGEDEKAPSDNVVDDGAPPSPPSPPLSRSTSKNEMAAGVGEYPTGEFEMVKHGWWMNAMIKLRMLFALPWERVKKGSVLTMKLRGRITDQLSGRFSSVLSLPQICENFVKAANDPRISGIYLHIEPLNCGWGEIEEIRRHILNFKKSGLKLCCSNVDDTINYLRTTPEIGCCLLILLCDSSLLESLQRYVPQQILRNSYSCGHHFGRAYRE